MAAFPYSLPGPLAQGYSISPLDGSLRSDMDSGLARVRLRSTARLDRVEATWRLRTAELAAWRAWVDSSSSYNLLQSSEDFANAYWGSARIQTRLPNAIAAPDGSLSADGLVPSTELGDHYIERNVTGLPPAAEHTASIHVRAAGSRDIQLYAFGTGNALHSVKLNTATGAAGLITSAEYLAGAGVTTDWGVRPLGGAWWLMWLSGYPDAAATNRRFRLRLTDAAGVGAFAGDGVTATAHVWGAQLAAGGLRPYLPTRSSAPATVDGLIGTTGWFDLRLPFGGVAPETRLARFVGAPSYRMHSQTCWDVSAVLEVR